MAKCILEYTNVKSDVLDTLVSDVLGTSSYTTWATFIMGSVTAVSAIIADYVAPSDHNYRSVAQSASLGLYIAGSRNTRNYENSDIIRIWFDILRFWVDFGYRLSISQNSVVLNSQSLTYARGAWRQQWVVLPRTKARYQDI